MTGGNIAAQNNPAFASGPPDSSPGPFNYLFYTPFGPSFPVATTFQGALREFSFSLTSVPITSVQSFDASEFSVSVASGHLDWGVASFVLTSLPPTESEIEGISSLPARLALATGEASLVKTDASEILTLPISADMLIDPVGEPLFAYQLRLHFSGEIVAVSAVPEPAILPLLLGLILMLNQTRLKLKYSWNVGMAMLIWMDKSLTTIMP